VSSSRKAGLAQLQTSSPKIRGRREKKTRGAFHSSRGRKPPLGKGGGRGLNNALTCNGDQVQGHCGDPANKLGEEIYLLSTSALRRGGGRKWEQQGMNGSFDNKRGADPQRLHPWPKYNVDKAGGGHQPLAVLQGEITSRTEKPFKCALGASPRGKPKRNQKRDAGGAHWVFRGPGDLTNTKGLQTHHGGRAAEWIKRTVLTLPRKNGKYAERATAVSSSQTRGCFRYPKTRGGVPQTKRGGLDSKNRRRTEENGRTEHHLGMGVAEKNSEPAPG